MTEEYLPMTVKLKLCPVYGAKGNNVLNMRYQYDRAREEIEALEMEMKREWMLQNALS